MLELFRLMMKEEYRLHVSYSSRQMFFTMPLFITLITAFFASTFSMLSDTIDLVDMVTLTQLGIFLYGVSVGTFGFLGRTYVERRYGRINFIVTMPFLIPITFRRTFLGMYLRDIAFYSVLILLPAFLGLLIAALIVPYSLVSVGLMFMALFMSFLLGISLSFAISVLYTRSLAAFAVVVVGLMVFLAGAGMLDLYPLGTAVPSLGMQLHFPPFQDDLSGSAVYLLACLAWFALFTYVALSLVPNEFVSKRSRYEERYIRFRDRLHLFRNYDSLLAKEMVDVARSGMVSKMLFAYIAPLLFLSLSTWYINTGLDIPVGFNAVFYAGMVGFFGVLMYNWLTNTDLNDYYETLPVDVPMIIRVKLMAYFILTSLVSTAFVIGIAMAQGETELLWVALPVLYITTVYMVVATAYLTGLRTSSFLFDPGVMGKFALAAVLPDLGITILSFSLSSTPLIALAGIAIMCFLLLGVSKVFYDGINRKWSGYSFT
jgi:hypothetical protein